MQVLVDWVINTRERGLNLFFSTTTNIFLKLQIFCLFGEKGDIQQDKNT